MAAAARPNPLAQGFYTVPEAARLIEHGSRHRIYGWLKGYRNSNVGPLLDRDFAPVADRQEMSFLDFIEVRFVEHFRYHKVKAAALRVAANRLRHDLNTDHPFATDHVHLVADKADIYRVLREAADETGDSVLLSLTSDNYVIKEIIEQGLVPGLTFRNHFATEIKPRPQRFPDILMNPQIAYGQPVVPSGTPTGALYRAWLAEEKNTDAVAYWYEIEAKEVLRAVDFERLLDAPYAQAA